MTVDRPATLYKINLSPNMETKGTPHFITKLIRADDPARCVDGRSSKDSIEGPQMLGGSIHPILLSSIYNNEILDIDSVRDKITIMQKSGIKTGAHRDTNANKSVSGCGLADNIKVILQTAIENKEQIGRAVNALYNENKGHFPKFDKPFGILLEDTYKKIAAYETSKIKLFGNALVTAIEKNGSQVETVEGNHAEQVAFVNLAQGTTLATKALNAYNEQAFNLDIKTVAETAKLLGLPEDFVYPTSLVMYLATEIVLVENANKPAVPVHVHF